MVLYNVFNFYLDPSAKVPDSGVFYYQKSHPHTDVGSLTAMLRPAKVATESGIYQFKSGEMQCTIPFEILEQPMTKDFVPILGAKLDLSNNQLCL